MPTGSALAERLRSVLHVLYLLFTKGYAASTGAHVARSELSAEGRPPDAHGACVAAG